MSTPKHTPRQVADEWQMSVEKVRRLIASGELKAVNVAERVGSRPRYLITDEAVREFLERRAVNA